MPLGFPGCEIVNGITHFNNEAYKVVNTKIVLGVDSEESNENNRNFITISLDINRFTFEVDGLIEVTETELINERPSSSRGNHLDGRGEHRMINSTANLLEQALTEKTTY